MIRRLIVLIAILAALPTAAQQTTTANQGQGSKSVVPWPVQGSAQAGALPVVTNDTPTTAGETQEVLVTNAAGGSTVPASALTSRKWVELQNLGPNPIYCTTDGSAPVVLSNGRRILPGDFWAPPKGIGPGITVKCIAATAAQVTTAATMVTELR